MGRAVEAYGAKAVDPADIISTDCDVYAPCALGATINDESLRVIKAKVIAGAANNQLKEAYHGDTLHEMGIVYAPDYVINAGGVINIADELNGYNKERAFKQVSKIYDNITRVLEISRLNGIPTSVAANQLAEERISLLRNTRSTFLRNGQHALSRRSLRG
ncbi:Leucine dehydrogenase [compost metagenome]